MNQQIRPLAIFARVKCDGILGSQGRKLFGVMLAHTVELLAKNSTEGEAPPGFYAMHHRRGMRDEHIRLDIGQQEVGLPRLQPVLEIRDLKLQCCEMGVFLSIFTADADCFGVEIKPQNVAAAERCRRERQHAGAATGIDDLQRFARALLLF